MNATEKRIERLHRRLNVVYDDPFRWDERVRIQRKIIDLECRQIERERAGGTERRLRS